MSIESSDMQEVLIQIGKWKREEFYLSLKKDLLTIICDEVTPIILFDLESLKIKITELCERHLPTPTPVEPTGDLKRDNKKASDWIGKTHVSAELCFSSSDKKGVDIFDEVSSDALEEKIFMNGLKSVGTREAKTPSPKTPSSKTTSLKATPSPKDPAAKATPSPKDPAAKATPSPKDPPAKASPSPKDPAAKFTPPPKAPSPVTSSPGARLQKSTSLKESSSSVGSFSKKNSQAKR